MMMRMLFAALAGTILFLSTPALAQQPDKGLWIGTLDIDPQTSLRVVVDIRRADDGTVSGTLDSPDQNLFELPLANIVVEGEDFAFTLPAIGAGWAGSWSTDKAGWDGEWRQQGMAWPLLLTALDPAARPQPEALPANWQIPADAELQALIEQRVAARPGGGFVLGIIEDGETRFLSSNADFGPDTVYEIGSMSKVFTALIMADMALKGEISLDDPLVKYLPEGATSPTRNGEQITLRQLSLQTSGLPRLPDNMPYGDPEDPYADYTEDLLLEFLASYELPRDIGSQYEYSNLGVGLLGYVLARAAGTDFESLLRARILDPLGMADTAIALPPAMQARFAIPHDGYMRPAKPWRLPVMEGAGAIRSTARDMLIFLAAVMDPQSPIAEAVALTLSDRTDQPGAQNATALGWMLVLAPDGLVLHHGGGTGGFRTHMAVQPETGRAVVGLLNTAPEPSATDIVLHALYGGRLASEIPIPPAPPPIPEREEIALTTAQLDRVTGTYRMPNGVEMLVEREGEQLTAQLTSQPAFPIFPLSEREFFWRIVDARVQFGEEDGMITGATLLQNGMQIPMEKIE